MNCPNCNEDSLIYYRTRIDKNSSVLYPSFYEKHLYKCKYGCGYRTERYE